MTCWTAMKGAIASRVGPSPLYKPVIPSARATDAIPWKRPYILVDTNYTSIIEMCTSIMLGRL